MIYFSINKHQFLQNTAIYGIFLTEENDLIERNYFCSCQPQDIYLLR